MTSKNELTRRLNELLKKTEDLQLDLRQLNEVILYSDLTLINKEEKKEDIKPIPEIKEEEKKIIVEEVKPEKKEPVNIVPPRKKEETVKINVPKQQPLLVKQKSTQAQPYNISKEPSQGFFERHPDLEKFIGERLMTFTGIAVLVTGIAFFVKYAIDKEWIGEAGRTLIGILSGAALISIAHRLRKNFVTFSSVLVGGGIAVEYFTISYSYHVYGMFNMPVTFGLLVSITAFTVLLSIVYDRKELAVVAIIGGFCTPLMIASREGHFASLCTYILLLDLGMLALAYYKKWNIINIISYAFTILLFSGALVNEVLLRSTPDYIPAFAFATAFYIVFFLMNVVNNLKQRMKFNAWEILALLSNTCLYYAAGYFILHAIDACQYRGLFTLLVAAFNCVFAFLLFRKQEVDKNLVYFLIGIVLTFVSLAGPVQLDGSNITLFWSAEMVLLFWLYQRSGIRLIRHAAVIINGAMALSLCLGWMKHYVAPLHDQAEVLPVFLNRIFITGLFAFGSLVAMNILLKKEKEMLVLPSMTTALYRDLTEVLALLVLYFTFFFETWYQLERASTSVPETVILLCGYNSLFMLLFMIFAQVRRSEKLKTISSVTGFAVCILYFIAPHFAEIQARASYLDGSSNGIAFMLHFVNSAIVAGIAVILFLRVKNKGITDPSFRDAFLWFSCILSVFMVSAELDHLQVLMRFNGTAQYTDLVLQQSHNITWPVAWGICSFIMMLLGMRYRIRQLRVFSLSLFALTVVKLIALGIMGGSEAGKIIAFISSGILLLLVAFMYQRLKKIISEDGATEKNKDDE